MGVVGAASSLGLSCAATTTPMSGADRRQRSSPALGQRAQGPAAAVGLPVWRRGRRLGEALGDASPVPCQVPAGVFMTILSRRYYYPHFIKEETKVLRGDITCPVASHNRSVTAGDSNPGHSDSPGCPCLLREIRHDTNNLTQTRNR